MRILGLSGSLRRDSHNTRLLRGAAALLPPGVALDVYEQLKSVPPYDEDDDTDRPPAAVAELRDAVARADGLLVVTPEYNSSLPGQLKNAIDWLSRPAGSSVLLNKPAAVAGASTGMFGAVWSQAEGRKVRASTGARVVDRELPVPRATESVDDIGALVEAEAHATFVGLLEELVSEAEAHRLARERVQEPAPVSA